MIEAGSVNIAVRAKSDALERDLAQANQLLNRFNQNATKDADGLGGSVQKTDKAYQELIKTIAKMGEAYSQLNSKTKEAQVESNRLSIVFAALGVASAGAMSKVASPAVAAQVTATSAALVSTVRLLTPWALAATAVGVVVEKGWGAAKKAIEEANTLLKAASEQHLDVSTYVGMKKAVEELKLSLDSVFDAFQRLDQVTAPRLGGDPLRNRVQQLTNFGNFKGNTGVDELKRAVSAEEKWRAVVTLLDQASEKGERLAALDIAKIILPPDLFEKVEAYGGYILKQLLDKSDKNRLSASQVYTINYAKGLDLRLSDIDDRIAKSAKYWEEQLAKPWLQQPTTITRWFSQLKEYIVETGNAIGVAIDKIKFGLMGAPETQTRRLFNIAIPGQTQFGPQEDPEGTSSAATAAAQRVRAAVFSKQRAFGGDDNTAQKATQEGIMAIQQLNVALRNEKDVLGAAKRATEEAYASMGDLSKEAQNLVDHLNDQIKLMKFETNSMGQSTEATTKLKIEQELLRAVKEGHLKIHPKTISALAEEYASTLQLLHVTSEIQKLKANIQVTKLGDIGTNEVAVVRMLQGLFKDDWVNQLDSLPAKLQRWDDAMKETKESLRKLREGTEQFNVSMQAVGALSPEQKGQVAARQEMLKAEQAYKIVHGENAKLSGQELITATELAKQAEKLTITQERFGISQAARMRELSSRQGVQTAQLEVDLIGKSIGEQERLRGILQAKHQLEQEAASRNGVVDQAHLTRLTKEITLQAQLKQLAAERKALDDAQFDRQTIFMDDTERQIAAVNRSLHANEWKSFMNDGLSATLRINASLKTIRDLTSEFVTGFARDFTSELRNGTKAWDAFSKAGLNALNRLADRLMDMALNNLINKAFGLALGSFGGGIGASTVRPTPETIGPFGSGHTGGIFGQIPATRYVHPAYFDDAKRYHSGGRLGPDEVPLIGKKGEEIGWPAQLAKKYGGGGGDVHINYTIDATNADRGSEQRIQAQLEQHKKELPGIIATTMQNMKRRSIRV